MIHALTKNRTTARVTTVLFIILGLIPSVVIRFVIARRPLGKGPAIGLCLGILLGMSIVVTGSVQRRYAKPEPGEVMGPIPILADWVYAMVSIGLPVAVLSFFVLRAPTRD